MPTLVKKEMKKEEIRRTKDQESREADLNDKGKERKMSEEIGRK
jgi:hypothetical protein